MERALAEAWLCGDVVDWPAAERAAAFLVLSRGVGSLLSMGRLGALGAAASAACGLALGQWAGAPLDRWPHLAALCAAGFLILGFMARAWFWDEGVEAAEEELARQGARYLAALRERGGQAAVSALRAAMSEAGAEVDRGASPVWRAVGLADARGDPDADGSGWVEWRGSSRREASRGCYLTVAMLGSESKAWRSEIRRGRADGLPSKRAADLARAFMPRAAAAIEARELGAGLEYCAAAARAPRRL